MPRILCALMLICLLFSPSTLLASNLHKPFDDLLKSYVVDGKVNYANLKNNRKQLDAYLDELSKISQPTFDTWSKDKRLSYLINLYNAATLQLIIDNYPVKSIKDIGSLFKSPWKQEFVKLFGKLVSLDTIEHEIIRKEYFEPRIHLALVCAAKSCPPLRSEAYEESKLSKQLDNQGEVFFASKDGIEVDHAKQKVYLSSIFKWYKEDFVSVIDFAKKYTNQNFDNYKLDYLNYDWSLNKQ